MGFRDQHVGQHPYTRSDDNFQYSLRIVGFRDNCDLDPWTDDDVTFSIPCESWGSATVEYTVRVLPDLNFQYSLRIVGFRDMRGCT